MSLVSFNGRLMDAAEAHIPHDDRGFRFGDGVFETIRFEAGVPYQWQLHMNRLSAGLGALRIDLGETHWAHAETRALIRQSELKEGLIRISVSRGSGSAGYRPLASATPLRLIELMPMRPRPQSPIRLWQSSWHKPALSALPTHHKLAQGINPTLALLEAEDHGCIEALQLSADGMLCEAASATLFWVQGQELFTPALSTGCLAGTTRAAILRLWDGPCHESICPPEVLHKADTVFLSHVGWDALPVDALLPQQWQWSHHHLIEPLTQALATDRATYARDHANDWR